MEKFRKYARKWICGLGILSLVLAAGVFFSYEERSDPLQPAIAEKILRFHVRANSDSEGDQEVKEEVRDAVGAMLQPKLAESKNIEMSRSIVQESIDDIVAEAESTLRRNGYDYEVKAYLTHTYFPEKTYGDYTFPEGEYEALEVVLGEGKGHNWWCVLYPNMCFRGSVFEVVNEDAKEALREVLTPEEYEDVFDSGNFKIHFKFLEYFR